MATPSTIVVDVMPTPMREEEEMFHFNLEEQSDGALIRAYYMCKVLGDIFRSDTYAPDTNRLDTHLIVQLTARGWKTGEDNRWFKWVGEEDTGYWITEDDALKENA